jgi:hypothetical protein
MNTTELRYVLEPKKSISLLFYAPDGSLYDLVRLAAGKLYDDRKIKIELDSCCGEQELRDNLSAKEYDFIIIHLGADDESVYELAQMCREISTAKLVAESKN